jgi:hypothetical protein
VVAVSFANGPGQRTPNGAVQPKGEPVSKQSMRLPEADMMKIMLAVYDYLHAYEAAHHHRIVAEKVREVHEKLAGRAERQLPAAAAPDDDERAPAAARPGTPPLRVVPGAPGPQRAPAGPAPRTQTPSRPSPPIVAAAPPARPLASGPPRPTADSAAPRYERPTRTG